MCKCIFVLGFLALLGVVILILGAVLGFVVFDDLIEDHVLSITRLENGTEQFRRWQEPPPMTFRVYMFNVNNPVQVMNGQKPNVTEVGPYVYSLHLHRGSVSGNTDRDTLTSDHNRTFVFNANASYPLTENDEITVLNTPLQGLIQLMEKFGTIAMARLNSEWLQIFPASANIFHTIRVRDYLFEGFRFCDMVINRPSLCNDVLQSMGDVKTLELLPGGVVSFSFFNHKVQDMGTFEIIAGMNNISRLGEIQTWNGTSNLDVWAATPNTCNQIRGGDSTIFPPFIETDFTFDVFNSDICRTINLVHSHTSRHQDIDGWRYNIRSDTLANASASVNHACFCTNITANIFGSRECLPDGFNDMFNCFGSNIVVSFPHLLWANPAYASTVVGLSPNAQNHITFANIEPDTGRVLESATRIQYNMFIRPVQGMTVTQQITPSVLPILWFEEVTQISVNMVEELDDYFSWLIGLEAATWILIGVGIFVIILSLIICVCRRK